MSTADKTKGRGGGIFPSTKYEVSGVTAFFLWAGWLAGWLSVTVGRGTREFGDNLNGYMS